MRAAELPHTQCPQQGCHPHSRGCTRACTLTGTRCTRACAPTGAQRTIGWSVRKAPFAGQGACGKEGTKWKMAMRTRREQQGARCSLTHGARGARGKMHASRCAHQGVRARKELAKKTSKWEQSGKSNFGSHLAFCAKKWFPVRFPIFVPMVSDAFLASILVFSCEQR